MARITVTPVDRPDITDILSSQERLLWSGQPGHGQRLHQIVDFEWVRYGCLLLCIIAMWAALPFIDNGSPSGRELAAWLFGVLTFMFITISLGLASQRQFVLCNLAYFLTDRRTIILRHGRNSRFGRRLYVISCPHSRTFPYRLHPSRPYASVMIGSLISQNELGLYHSGHPISWGRTSYPILLDYLPDAQEVLEKIEACVGRDADLVDH